MTVESTNPTVKLQIADVTAEIPNGTSEQMITAIIRTIRNACLFYFYASLNCVDVSFLNSAQVEHEFYK